MPDIAASIETILGSGYSGAANLDGNWLMLRSSTATEDDNLIKSTGNMANLIPHRTGEVPVRNRRSLTLNLNADLTYAAIQAAVANSFTWRTAGSNGKQSTVSVILANGEGYQSTQAYVESFTLQVPEGQLGQISFAVKCHVWSNLSGDVTPRLGGYFNPFFDSSHQPIPHWAAPVEHGGHPGIPTSWSLSVNNAYTYYQLCEGVTDLPPNPRVVVPGPMMVDLNLTTLAYPSARPTEWTTDVSCQIGGYNISGVTVPATTITFPLLVRDPSRQVTGFGDQNMPVKWQASWKSVGICPTVT